MASQREIERALLCIAEGRPGDWEAICLDLDIAVQGGTFEEVRSLLDEAVNTYVLDARKEAPANRDRLLNRRAPIRVRFVYGARMFLNALLSRRRDGALHSSFEIPCRA